MDIPYRCGYVLLDGLHMGDDIIEDHGLSWRSYVIDIDELYHTIFKLRWE